MRRKAEKQYFEFGLLYPFQPLAINITYCTFKTSSKFQATFKLHCYIDDYVYMFILESHVAEVDGGEKADREADGKVSRTNIDLIFNT